jgi:Protein of unknown function (DUF4013)
LKFKDILMDSLKYPLSDIKMILLLGIVLLIANVLDDHISDFSYNPFFLSIGIILLFFFAMLEVGYIFKVVEHTVKGNNRLPKFAGLWSMFIHGIKETTVSLTYYLLPVVVILIGGFYLNSNASPAFWEHNLGMGLLIAGIILIFPMTFFLLPAILNMAHHKGKLRSAYNFIQIKEKTRNVGIKNLLIPYLVTWIVLGSFYLYFAPQVRSIPLIGSILSQMIITPFLIILTGRILGLVDK